MSACQIEFVCAFSKVAIRRIRQVVTHPVEKKKQKKKNAPLPEGWTRSQTEPRTDGTKDWDGRVLGPTMDI